MGCSGVGREGFESGTYKRFRSERPRKAPGWMMLIKLFFRSLEKRRKPQKGVRKDLSAMFPMGTFLLRTG